MSTALQGEEALCKACKQGDVVLVSILLGLGAYGAGWKPLYCASKHGQTAIARLLVYRGGVSVTAQDNAALCAAFAFSHYETALFLLSAGADPNARGGSLLFKSVANRNVEFVQLLIQYDVDMSSNSNECLVKACELGDCEVVNALLSAGADPNYPNGMPLIVSAENNRVEVINLLLSFGADLYLDAALEYAQKISNHTSVFCLLEAGAKCTIPAVLCD